MRYEVREKTVKRIGTAVLIAMLGLILGLTIGCRKGETPEEKAEREMREAEPKYDNSLKGEEGIKNAIRGYNQAVIHGNMKQEYLKFVRKYASDHEASRVTVFVEEDRSLGRVMRSKLIELAFDKFTDVGDFTHVYTTERWEFDYLDIKTGKVKEPLKEMQYKLKYIMVKDKDKWIVGRLEQTEKPLVTTFSPPRSLDEVKD